jgi:GNAT superfamily N-acetyltransferase
VTLVRIQDADSVRDLAIVERLWRDYLTWGNDEMQTLLGFRLPVSESIARDIASISKFAPPDGRLLLAWVDNVSVATAALQRLTDDTAEIKRMYVQPDQRRGGIGRAMLNELLITAKAAGHRRVRLDSPSFMTDAHRLYRSAGFVDIEPYSESEIPDQFKEHWLFMELQLGR